MKRCALYARVSTDGQSTDNQIEELRRVAAAAGWEVTHVFLDQGISGSKGRDKRPGLDKLLKAVTARQVDMVAAWSVDRLGRSLPHLLDVMGELHATGVGLYLHQQRVDTTTPAGRALFQMMGVFAEFERAMIVERVKAGLSRAVKAGVRLGRPRDMEMEETVLAALAKGKTLGQAAKAAGCTKTTAHRIKERVAAHG